MALAVGIPLAITGEGKLTPRNALNALNGKGDEFDRQVIRTLHDVVMA